MADHLAVTDLRFAAASMADCERGLLGFASFTLGPLRLDGVAVRRTSDGRFALSFPVRHDRSGRQHPIVRPVDRATRVDIERQVLSLLGIKSEEAAP